MLISWHRTLIYQNKSGVLTLSRAADGVAFEKADKILAVIFLLNRYYGRRRFRSLGNIDA